MTSYTSRDSGSLHTCTYRQGKVGLTLLLWLQSRSIPVRVLKYSYLSSSTSAYCIHTFIWKHLQDSDFSPFSPHQSWFGCCYFIVFRNMCSYMSPKRLANINSAEIFSLASLSHGGCSDLCTLYFCNDFLKSFPWNRDCQLCELSSGKELNSRLKSRMLCQFTLQEIYVL